MLPKKVPLRGAMSLMPKRLIHWLALAVLALATAAIAYFWSARSAGYPDPRITRAPTHQIGDQAAAQRAQLYTLHLLRCLDALGKDQPARAISFCNLASQLAPREIAPIKLRAAAYVRQGKITSAIAEYDRAIRLNPGDAEAWRFRGVSFAFLGQRERAIRDFSEAIRLAPNDPLNREFRGLQYELLGKYEPAIADFNFAIKLQPLRASAWNARCWARALVGKELQAALADCNRALEINAPDVNVNAFDSKGFVLLRLGRYRESVASYDEALKRRPKFASSLFGRGIARLKLGAAGGMRDIIAARALEPGIENRFAQYGVHVPGPAGI